MSLRLRAAIESEWQRARAAAALGELDAAFGHLERAHVLSQRVTFMHVRTHLYMLGIGWRRRDAREVLGQVSRTLAASLFSRLWVPPGKAVRTSVRSRRCRYPRTWPRCCASSAQI